MKFKKLNYIIIILTSLILIGYIFIVDNPQNLFNALDSARPKWLMYALASLFSYWLLDSFALRSLCNKLSNNLSIANSFRTTMAGQLFNCITPFASGGQPMQAYMLSNSNIPIGEASCVLLAKFIVYQLTLTVYSTVVILFKFRFFMHTVSGFAFLVILGFVLNIIVVSLLVGIGFFPSTTNSVLFKFTYLLHKFKLIKDYKMLCEKITVESDNFYHNFSLLKGDLKFLIFPIFISTLQLTAFFMIPYFVCLSLGIPRPDLFTVICAAAFVLLVSSFIPLPGASGGAEGSFYLFFNIFFAQTGLLGIAIILWRMFTFYLPIIVGMFFAQFEKKSIIPDL